MVVNPLCLKDLQGKIKKEKKRQTPRPQPQRDSVSLRWNIWVNTTQAMLVCMSGLRATELGEPPLPTFSYSSMTPLFKENSYSQKLKI